MSFMYPLGLLGLLAIPIIIVIYILQSKYTEQTVPSTFLWHLSDRFLKRKNPLSGLTGVISLVLQILTVAVISLVISRPVFTLPGAAHDYCFVLDASGSMTVEEEGGTRFDAAKDEITELIKSAKDGSSFSLISVSSETVTVFDGVKNKESAIEMVEDLLPTHTSPTHETVLGAAQRAFDSDSGSRIYLVTDKSYREHDNIKIISVGGEENENYAVSKVGYSHSGAKLSVEADVISYKSAAELEIALIVDGKETAVTTVSVESGRTESIRLESACKNFSSFKVCIKNDDPYMIDNSNVTYNLQSDKSYSILIVSESGFFFEAAIDAFVDSDITVVDPDKYEEVTEKYGLYVFDSYVPETLPDAAVWLINADKSVDDAGFGIRGKVELPVADTIEKSKQTSTSVRRLLSGIDGEDIYISKYVKYSGMYLNFSTLFTYDSNPVIFAGTNGLGNRQVVFGFDIHESDFALSTDFVMLIGNLINYSFPGVIDKSSYTVGDDVIVSRLSNAQSYKALSPSGKDIFVDMSTAETAIRLDEVGTYVFTVTVADKEVPYYVYSAAHPSESKPASEEESFSLSGSATERKIDGEFDPTVILFICLAVLFVADWGVYCYEKYQLR